MPLDPQAKAVLELLASLGLPPLDELTPEQARANSVARHQPPRNPIDVHRVEDRTIPGPAGEIPVRIYTPAHGDPMPVLLYFHGGGWVLGDLDGSDLPPRKIANHACCVVISVDYRLAPEHRFPAAIDDCFAATVWAAEHAAELGTDASRIAVGGDSAGGNLAAAVALLAHERGGPALTHQALIYPVIDRAFDTPSYEANGDGYGLTKRSMQWFWDHYLGPDSDGGDWRASPARAGDLSGLPPALVVTAEFDPLRDEGEAYAERLRQAGVPVTCTRYDGQMHGFFNMPEAIDDGDRAIAEVGEALKSAFAS